MSVFLDTDLIDVVILEQGSGMADYADPFALGPERVKRADDHFLGVAVQRAESFVYKEILDSDRPGGDARQSEGKS